MKYFSQILAMAILLSGCGGSKDPLKKYPLIKNDVIPTFRKIEEQNFRSGCGMQIIAQPMTVSEGSSLVQDVYLRGPLVTAEEDLIVLNGPEGLGKPEKKGETSEGLKFQLQFSPSKGTLNQNKLFQEFRATLLPLSQKNSQIQCPTTLTLNVTVDEEVPEIAKISFPEVIDINGSDSIDIVVLTKAPPGTDPSNLAIYWGFDRSSANPQEIPAVNLSEAVRGDFYPSSAQIEKGEYKFLLHLDRDILKRIIADYTAKKSAFINRQDNRSTRLEGHLQVRVLNSSGGRALASPAQNLRIFLTHGDSSSFQGEAK
ncbi:MAG: hypothetical protein KDD35_01090 [Bdellovibrionales bacterium]|nr:hypothetical protein [Bdellovibrionales bacterium]